MDINLEQYVSLLQGLCSLNIYIGFQIDIRCNVQVPSTTLPLCSVNRITPVDFQRRCSPYLLDYIPVERPNITKQRHCFIHYCRKRLKRSLDERKGDTMAENTNGSETKGNETRRSLVRSTAFGNPSLPQPPPRRKKKRPPRTKPKETG